MSHEPAEDGDWDDLGTATSPAMSRAEAQSRAVELFLAGTSVQEVAAEVGVDRRTLHRWRTSPWWQRAEDLHAAELRREAQSLLEKFRPQAVKALGALLKLAEDEPTKVPASESVRAAQLLLSESKPLPSEMLHRQLRVLLAERMEGAVSRVRALEPKIGRDAIALVIAALAGNDEEEDDGEDGGASTGSPP